MVKERKEKPSKTIRLQPITSTKNKKKKKRKIMSASFSFIFFSSLSLFGNKQTDPNRYSIFLLYFILFQNLLLTRNVTNDTLSQKIDVKVYHCLCLAVGRKYEQINSYNQITTNSTKHKNI